MPTFGLTFLRVDRDVLPTVMEALFLSVDWPVMPREGEGVEILEELESQPVASVGYGIDGSPLVYLGSVVIDDLQMQQLRRVGWRVAALPGGPTR